MPGYKSTRRRKDTRKYGTQQGVMRDMSCIDKPKCGLLDLPEALIVSILRSLPTQSKCRAESVCKIFRQLLSDPAPGSFVWDRVSLEDKMFQKPSVQALKRWLLQRIQGILLLHHRGQLPRCKISINIRDSNRRDQQIAFTAIPYTSMLLSPQASLHLDLTWVTTKGLFTPEEPQFQHQYWSSLSRVLTHLELSSEEESLTEGMSAALCQATRLQRLRLITHYDKEKSVTTELGIMNLNLPLLQRLEIRWLRMNYIQVRCPQLGELVLGEMPLSSFRGMPNSIRKVSLTLHKGSAPVQEIMPLHSAMALEELTILEETNGFTDPEAVMALCLNGKLRCLRMDSPAAHAGAFSVNASWQAIPRTLQEVSLSLPLDEGIPRILEQLPNLMSLSLKHTRQCRMHLDRPLDPFLDMPKLMTLELQSSWNKDVMDGTGVCMWTPIALGFLGLAEKRIMRMQKMSPKRSITLIC